MRHRRLLAALLALGAAAPAPAAAQGPLPPTLAADPGFAAPVGIARTDFGAGASIDVPAGVAVDGDRIYTVGRTDTRIGVVAHRTDGSLDRGFSGDGKLVVSIAPGTDRDIGTGIVVLPDHRVRVVAATDVVAGSGESLDVAIVGLNPDGTPDLAFGAVDGAGPGRTGRIVFPAGPSNDVPARIVAGPGGRLAIIGSRSDGTGDDVFVSLREPDGAPVAGFGTNGVRVLGRSGTFTERGVDVEFRAGGGLLGLMLVATNNVAPFGYTAVLHAFTVTGADDPAFSQDGDLVLPVGSPDTVPGGLVAYGGRLYATGYTRAGAATDTDAFLARVEADGSGFDSRTFDLRGKVVPAGQAVASRAFDLAVVPGAPPALVAVGGVDWASSAGSTATNTDWGAAAFNGFEGPLAAARSGDLVLPAPGQGQLLGVAAGAGGWAAVAGTYVDASATSSADNSYGDARLLLDADKRCDLAVTVAEPGEVTFHGSAPAALTATVTNKGTRACAGTLSASGAYRLGPFSTGTLGPGQSATARDLPLTYSGPRRAEDFARVAVSAADDADATNNEAVVHLVFRFCDLAVRAVGAPGLMPSEGRRGFDVSLRNAGTADCRVRVGARAAYPLAGGKSVADRVRASAPRGARPGRRTAVVLRAAAAGDVDRRNNAAVVSPVVVAVGDSDLLRWGAQRFAGRAVAGRGGGVARARLRLSRVEVAVVRRSRDRCAWLTSTRGGFASRRTDAHGGCGTPRWLRARGTSRWHLRLARRLPAGRYIAYSRATIRAGFPEARFTRRDRNRIDLRVH